MTRLRIYSSIVLCSLLLFACGRQTPGASTPAGGITVRTLPAKATQASHTSIVPTASRATEPPTALESTYAPTPTQITTTEPGQDLSDPTLTLTQPVFLPSATQLTPRTTRTRAPNSTAAASATGAAQTATATRTLTPTISPTPARIPLGLPGIWQQEFTGWWLQFNLDGSFRVADTLQNLSIDPNDSGTYQIDVVQVNLVSRSSSLECSRQTGSYTFTIDNQGLVQYTVQQDACPSRQAWLVQYPWRLFSENPSALSIAGAPLETHFLRIKLGGIGTTAFDITGMAWYNDVLILLPRDPRLIGGGDGALYAIPKQDIKNYLGGISQVVAPVTLPLFANGVVQAVPGFTGYEAITFIGDQAFVLAHGQDGGFVRTFLLSGNLNPEQGTLTLQANSLVEIASQGVSNQFGSRTLLFQGNAALAALCEANGSQLNPSPQVARFATSLTPLGNLAFPNLEYRLNDGTGLDDQGYFWVINRYRPGEGDVRPASDPLIVQYGQGATHQSLPWVERLVEFQYVNGVFELAARAPIQLELAARGPRDWQALTRLDGLGFLIAGSYDGQILLGFIANP